MDFTSPSNNLKMGIVGLPNIGKSTLFNLLTHQSVPSSNYPFCTKDPNDGIIAVADPRIDFLSNVYSPRKTTFAALQVSDIAGLVKGASEGVGLGNAFLEHIRCVDGIFHVVQCFEDDLILRTEKVDPLGDIKIINDELRLKDLEIVKKMIGRRGNKLLEKIRDTLEEKWINEGEWTQEEVKEIIKLNFLTTKKVVYVANVGEDEYEFLNEMKEKKTAASTENTAGNEQNNKETKRKGLKLGHIKKIAHLKPIWYTKTTINTNDFVRKGYEALSLINFFTAGKDEVRSWTIKKNTEICFAGAVIHTDFSKYFITAEVMKYSDFEKCGNEVETRKAGKVAFRGKGYFVEDGDIINFRAGKK